ncbi:hypothetical protein FRB90_012388 [Tulasnella sp. 427]|nr:hypothetical protein FRB90_012388 [Tulasnella sp. 427]
MNPVSASSSNSGNTLKLITTFDEPAIIVDPGLGLKLKRTYNGQECFDKFLPYLRWLRSWLNKNSRIASKDMNDQYQSLWEAWKDGENELGNTTAVKEFFSQKAHAEVEALWRRYRALRRQMEDAATENVTFKVSRAADDMATAMFRAGGSWRSEATVQGNVTSPEERGSVGQRSSLGTTNPVGSNQIDPFVNPEDSINGV